jgi:hypothetical protein
MLVFFSCLVMTVGSVVVGICDIEMTVVLSGTSVALLRKDKTDDDDHAMALLLFFSSLQWLPRTSMAMLLVNMT